MLFFGVGAVRALQCLEDSYLAEIFLKLVSGE
jgi:hypothetical protein